MILLPFLGAFLNRLAGAGLKKWWASKTVTPVYYALAVYFCTYSGYQAVVVAIGMWLYRMLGWGDYWDGTTKKNKEVALIDWLVSKVLPAGFWNDFLSMSLRGLCCAPLFIGLSFVAWQHSWMFSFFGAWQGFVYFGIKKYYGESKMSEYSEPIMGFILLTFVSAALYLA